MNKRKIIKDSSAPLEVRKIHETNSGKCLISLEKAIVDDNYGLCLSKKHKQHKAQNAKKYNTKLIEFFYHISKQTWNDIHKIPKDQKFGHEHFKTENFKAKNIKSYFLDLGKDKCSIFRFGDENKLRACGYRENDTFYLVCVDYDFSLYEHGN